MNDAQRQEHVDHVLHQRSEFAEYERKNTRPVRWEFGPKEWVERAQLVKAMREGQLRGAPTCFGELS